MLSGTTLSALAITGTAVFRMVASSDSIKKATATSQGSSLLRAELGKECDEVVVIDMVKVSGPICSSIRRTPVPRLKRLCFAKFHRGSNEFWMPISLRFL